MVALRVIRDRVIQFIQLVRDPGEHAIIATPQNKFHWLNWGHVVIRFSTKVKQKTALMNIIMINIIYNEYFWLFNMLTFLDIVTSSYGLPITF